jgi:hypothetical protein
MKITLDISKLVEEGKITAAEAERLKALASHDTGSLGINVLIGFGVVSVASGAVALVPTPMTAVGLGILLFAAGLAIVLRPATQWGVFGQICLVIGALMFGGGVLVYAEGSLASSLIVTVAFALAAIAARSSLLMALAVLGASACLGARTGYSHAMYSLAIFEPTLTIVLFSGLALVAYHVSKRLPADYERIALTASRTSILLVNFGFWIGSLWGDPLMLLRGMSEGAARVSSYQAVIPDWAFSIGWALALIAAGVWAASVNRRWLVNTAATFGAIHFYTQWFERLGATPVSVLLAGVLLLTIALALWGFNRRPAAATPAA